MYPFDFQLCNISFMLMNAPWSRVFRRTSPTNQVPYLNSRRVVLEYALENVTTEIGSFLQGTDNNTYFALTYHLRRIYGYHVTNSFFPSLLMFFISYATFYFQLDDFTNRIMISLTAQLVLASLFTSTTQSSVRTPYLKLIDVWYAAIITFCFIIIICQTVINVIFHTRGVPKAVYRVVLLRDFDLRDSKVISVAPESGHEKARSSPGQRLSSTSYPELGTPEGQVVARRYNAVSRVSILAVVVTFVVVYSYNDPRRRYDYDFGNYEVCYG
ncbi:uncharacterized protein LOC122246389 [Penaeus japonicus]|uniref:uncharacterized protein LOC122246389 n=1 Tax=Penaeus japonicus TaxID=27405 RepID=UPI001C70C147|nr:uncharacterized protein LOC122246389 [Penaeus japonicus]